MTQDFNRIPQLESSLNEKIVGAFQASILVLAGIISLAQFAYY
ncbi:MAG TPA: hypothetical protein VGK90_04185 [Rhizomicrobium sp.]|jgi:hypothetical protein